MSNEPFLWLILLLLFTSVALLIFALLRLPRTATIDALREEFRCGREEAGRAARDTRDEISKGLRDANDTLSNALTGVATVQRTQLEGMNEQIQNLSQSNYGSLDRLSNVLDGRVKDLQTSNEAKFELKSVEQLPETEAAALLQISVGEVEVQLDELHEWEAMASHEPE